MSGFRDLEQNVLDICNTTFGTSVSYTPSGGLAVDITGVFDNVFVEINEVSSLHPVLRIKLSDLEAAPAKGDAVSISSTNYRVLKSEPDGYGGSLLILQKV